MLSSQGHKGGEWGQRLNGMEKRCDWLITVMEHVASAIGLFTHPPHPSSPRLLSYATLRRHLQSCACENVHTDTVKVKHWPCKVPAAV